MMKSNKLILFQSKQIRRIWHLEEWFYSVVDIIEALTDSPTPRQYCGKVKQREFIENELSPIWVQLKLRAPDGKERSTDCVNTKNALRLVQSIPSRKAEPFKRWLAEVGKERLEEIENPELAQERMKQLYEQKGYPKDWIDKRLRGIAIRQNLTDEWKERGITDQMDYAILTEEISKATLETEKMMTVQTVKLEDSISKVIPTDMSFMKELEPDTVRGLGSLHCLVEILV